jgi:hypothetical protein
VTNSCREEKEKPRDGEDSTRKYFLSFNLFSIKCRTVTGRGFQMVILCSAVLLVLTLNNGLLQKGEVERVDQSVLLVNEGAGKPESLSFESPLKGRTEDVRPDLILAALNNDELLHEAESQEKKGRYFFATAREIDLAPHSAGRWEADGERMLWDVSLRSENALSLNLGFSEFYLPPDSALTISDPSGKSQPVTFTNDDNDVHGELWTPLFASDSLRLVLNVPGQLASGVRLRIAKVNHGFRPPTRRKNGKAIGNSSSGSCNIDVVCNAENDPAFGPLVELYLDQIRSVAAYTLGGIETCSGALINNVRNNLTPFFLTANHCEISSANAASVVVYWNFENAVCRTPGSSSSGGNGNGPITEFNSGSIFRASRAASDFCLIELDDPVDPAFSPYYSGWDHSGNNPVSAVGIHHPGVSEKRISFESDATTTTNYYGDSPTPGGTHVRVSDWDFGTTEGGSSGSPLFDDRGRIIGQLHGGDAACGNDLADWYGRLSRSWADGSDSASRLSDWLDPDQSGAERIDGINSDEILTVAGGSVTESNQGAVSFEAIVTLNTATDETVSVTLKTQDGTATAAGNDFLPVDTRLVFVPGETSKSVMVMIHGDLDPEENETFSLVLEDAVNAAASGQPGVVAILNDDFILPEINSSLSAVASASSSFEYRISALNTPTDFAISNAPAGMMIDGVTGVLTWSPGAEGGFTVEITATNPAGSDTETLAINVLPNLLVQAVDLPTIINLSNSSPGWFLQTTTTRDGVDAAQADYVGDGGVAAFSLELDGPDRLTFQAKVSSEADYDFLTVELDGVERISLSGEVDWSEHFVNIPVGRHTVAFQYGKDGSASEGDDSAWVDQFSLASETGKPIIVSSLDLRIDTGSPFSYVIDSIDPGASFLVSGLPSGLTFDGDKTISGFLVNQGSYSFTIISSANGESDSETVRITVANPVGPSVEVTNFTWIREGSANWYGQTVINHDGFDAAQSGEIDDGEMTSMSVRVTGPDRMTFWWKVSSEEGFDGLAFEIDGSEVPGVTQISGERDWAYVSVRIPSGSHLLSWIYSKDPSSESGSDAGWVDDIRFASGSRPLVWTSSHHEVIVDREVRIPLEFVNADNYSFESLPPWLDYDEELQALVGIPPGVGEFAIMVVASNPQGDITLPIMISAAVPNGALALAIERPELVVSTSGARDWLVDRPVGATGGSAARSGNIDDSEASSMVVYVQGPGTLTFRWTVSSEEDFDFLKVAVNGALRDMISGEVGWEEVTIDLAPGLNQVSWIYEKDSSSSEGGDLGRVDGISLGGYARFLSGNQLDHFSSDPGDDVDGDGNTLLHEYAFLGSPSVWDAGNTLTLGRVPGSPDGLEMTFSGLNPGEGIDYRLEASPDLTGSSWEEAEIVPDVSGVAGGFRYRYSTVPAPVNQRSLFYRVRAGFEALNN